MTFDRSSKWLEMLRAAAIVIACSCSAFSSIYTPITSHTVLIRNARQNNEYHRQPYESFINWWGANQTEDSDSTNLDFPSNSRLNDTGANNVYSSSSTSPLQDSKEYSEEEGIKLPTSYPNEPPPMYVNMPDQYPSAPVQSDIQGLYPGYPQYANPPVKYQEVPATQSPDVSEPIYISNNQSPQQDYSTQAPVYPQKNPFGPSEAPPFVQSLEDFQEATKTVLSRIQNNNSSRDESEKQMRYTIIAGVLDGMIKTMSKSRWQYYDKEYHARVPGLFRSSQAAGYRVKAQLACIYRWAEKNIIQIKKVINNRWITYLCRVSDIPCDVLILATIDAVDDDNLKQEARLLVALGKASRLFLSNYSKNLDRETSVSNNRPSNLYMFIMSAKDYFKPLIQASSDARKLLPSPLYCHDQPSPGGASFTY